MAPVASLAQPEVLSVHAHTERAVVRAGERTALAVVINHEPGWHVHTNSPKVPPSWGDFIAIPTQVTVNAPKSVRIGPTQWPAPHPILVDLAGTGRPTPYDVFEGEAIIYVPLLIASDASGEIALDVTVSYQACDDKVCLMPETQTFQLKLAVGEQSAAVSDARLFAEFDRAVFDRVESWPAPPKLQEINVTPPRTFFGIPLPRESGLLAILVLFLLSILGGMILNLTPCVLPVIPLKVMTLSQHAGSPGRMLYLGLWMAMGVVVFWVGIGLPVLIFSAFKDPSTIFGIWWVTFGLGVLIAIMALGLMGLFNIQLPQGLYMLNPKADTAWGSFLFGIMTAVLGLPCFGFVAGALLAAAATLPKLMTLLTFLGLGVGMALPYLLLAWKPGWIERIPRTGPASDLVKQVLGLLLLAAGAYFIGSGLIGLVAGKPYMGKVLHWWAVALFALLAGQWLLVRTYQITRGFGKRVVFTVIALALGVGTVTLAWSATQRAKYDRWVAYSPESFKTARDAGKIVVVDFTAQWCITCQGLKATVLERDPVRSVFQADDILLMKVDYTGKNLVGEQFQNSLGRVGIPLLAIFPPGDGEPWLSNSYTGLQVVEAIEAARRGGRSLAGMPK